MTVRRAITVVGARPQFVKAAMVSRALAAAGQVEDRLLHTGQHYDPAMSDLLFAELGLPDPAWNLDVGSGAHGAQTARMLEGIEAVLRAEAPDVVIVHGDTNSTLAGALAAAKLGIPVAHVEAGLRSFNRAMPEEINRILTDHAADVLFAPTPVAMAHLAREGIPGDRCHLVGDVMYDAVLAFGERALATSPALAAAGLSRGGYILATVHRAENTGSLAQLETILDALAAAGSGGVPVVLPMHPRTRALLDAAPGGGGTRGGLLLMPPVGYFDMLALEAGARLIVTDSGGVQKEAFFHRVPCLTLRGETEWTELLEIGWNRLVPPGDGPGIVRAVREALDAPQPPEPDRPLYGGGRAGQSIARILATAGPGSA